MRKLGEAFYGRVKSYEAAFAVLPERGDLEALLKRTALEGIDESAVPALADYVLVQRAALAKAPLAGLLEGQAAWAAR
jgi:cytochrome b pre-mRNA-processing protein 3